MAAGRAPEILGFLMNILIFNWRDMTHPQAGGAEIYLHEQARLWVEQGYRVAWICGASSGHPARDVRDGIEILRMGGTYGVYLCAWWQYIRLGWKPDVIVDAENGIPFFTPLYTRVPVVLLIFHVHTDVWKREFSGLAARVGNWLESWLMPRVYRKNQIVTISKSSEKMVRELFPSNPLELVYSAVDENYHPGVKSDSPELLYVGRLKRYKYIDVILRAMAELKDSDCMLNIVGQGDDESRLRTLCDELGLNGRVCFLGFVSEEKKKELLQRAWIFVNPSSMEGWGITNIEANACGTPVLGADVPGIQESVSTGKSGWLIPCGDVHALTDNLQRLLRHPEELDALRESSLQWADKFSWKESAAIFLDVLKKAVSAKSDQPGK
ncbi:MAG: glycosyltransferase family 4 protein [Kiritimatiellales bacterium]|nr:glycosyltransferase family 4 protein [Kiritimatiellales bacterium]